MFHHPTSHPRPVFSAKELRGRPFFDRYDAGRRLGDRLRSNVGIRGDEIVIALPRGGVAVGDEIARMFSAPLDILTVCTIGAPRHRELAIGAIAAQGPFEIDDRAASQLSADADDVRRLKRIASADAQRRDAHFRHDRAPLDVFGRRVILVDDGSSTAPSMHVAIRTLRAMHPSQIIVAIPVAPQAVVRDLESFADVVECLVATEMFDAIDKGYVDFHQLTDIEVCSILDDALDERHDTIH